MLKNHIETYVLIFSTGLPVFQFLTVNFFESTRSTRTAEVLDESGRQRPILIQSNQSSLLERLQINEFLYEAQQSRTPIPLVVEKIAQVPLVDALTSVATSTVASRCNTII